VVLAASGCGAVILIGCVVFAADTPPLGYLRLALLTLAAAAAFSLDEPAADAVDATPTTRTRRTAVRSLALVAPSAVWLLGLLGVEQRVASTPVLALLLEGVGAMTAAFALAACLRSAGLKEPGDVVASVCGAAILGMLLINPVSRSLRVFPVAEGWAASSALWASLTLVSVVVTIAASRDQPHRQRLRP
jgi:hypothetical protein